MVKVNENGTIGTSSAGAKVTVALKHPSGIYLQLCKMEEKEVLTAGDSFKTVKEAVRLEGRIRLNGTAIPFGVQPEYRIVAGYALTEGVDKDFFDEWMKQNADSALVKNELIFAYEKADSTTGKAKEHASSLSGLEPLMQTGDPRAPRRIQPDDGKRVAA